MYTATEKVKLPRNAEMQELFSPQIVVHMEQRQFCNEIMHRSRTWLILAKCINVLSLQVFIPLMKTDLLHFWRNTNTFCERKSWRRFSTWFTQNSTQISLQKLNPFTVLYWKDPSLKLNPSERNKIGEILTNPVIHPYTQQACSKSLLLFFHVLLIPTGLALANPSQ